MHLEVQPPELVLSGIDKTFGEPSSRGVAALRSIDLVVPPGEVLALVGPSGCGKSTLLRIIAGLDPAYEGRVAADGLPIHGPSLGRGMMFQEHRLLPWLTVEENIAFGLTSLEPAVRNSVIAELVGMVGLRGFEQAYPHQLSGGMAQRAALARALAPGPGVLLLDEPFAALDSMTRAQLQEELLRLRAVWRPTLILVTHDLEEAVFLADRVAVMSERPGTISALLPIELPHPRDRTSEAFGRVRRAVLEVLHCCPPAAASTTRTASTHTARATFTPALAELLPRESP